MIRFWLYRQLPPGTMIDGWKVVRPLGDGGFGAVFLVERDGHRFALKLALRRESSRDDKQTHARTERELSILLLLGHPNIIKPLAHSRWGDPRKGRLYFVMDYVEGWTLAQWVKRKHPTFREIIRVFRKLAAVLTYLHGKAIFHRDLKLVNVVLRKSDGQPVLIDFGCATHAQAEELTDSPAPPGTPRYQPPQVERFIRENRNRPEARYPFQVADELFSLGVMLYEVLTEPRPTEESAMPVLNRLWERPVPPHEKNPRVPIALSNLVMELLEREPSKRPESGETLDRELAELEAHQGPEYDETAHLPSAQREPAEDSNVLPFPPPEPPGLAAQLALRVSALAARVLRWHKGLLLGSAGAAVGLAAVLMVLALWPSEGPRPTPPAPGVAPVAPPLSSAGPAALGSPASAPAEVETKGLVSVTTQKPEAVKPSPTERAQKQPRGAHTAGFLAWCKSFAIIGTVTAVASGCPGAQVRPEPFQCPEGASELMFDKWGWSSSGVEVLLDDRYKPSGYSWVQSGPVVGVKRSKGDWDDMIHAKKPIPIGTRFIGHLWMVPEPSEDGSPGYVVVRYDRVEFPDGENAPVCLMAGGDRELRVRELKDGTGKFGLMEVRVRPVYGWEPERPK